MNAQMVVPSLFRKGVLLFCLAGLIGTGSLAAPIQLPDWAKPIESQLPEISPEAVSEVDDLYTYWSRNFDDYHPEVRQKLNEVAQRLVELREQIGPAMIWQYLKDDGLFSGYNQLLLSWLCDDSQLAVSLLPVIRCRMSWLKQMIQDPELAELRKKIDYHRQIYDMQGYLYAQGNDSDIEVLNELMEEDVRQGSSEFLGEKRVQQESETIRQARESAQLHDKPYWQLFANHLIEQNLLGRNILQPALQIADNKNPPSPMEPRKLLPESTISNSLLQPWMVWCLWLLVGLVSAILLRAVFWKSNQ